MKAQMSKYLLEQKKLVKKLVNRLSKEFAYVSVLGTDNVGKQYSVLRTGTNIQDSMWTERGFVVRVHNGKNYSEFSFNELSKDKIDQLVKKISNKVRDDLAKLEQVSIKFSSYPMVKEDKVEKTFLGEVEIVPEDISAKEKIEKMTMIKNKALESSNELVDFRVLYEEVKVSKIFISTNKDLSQSYIWSQGALFAVARREDNTKFSYEGFGELKGGELLDDMENVYPKVVENAINLLDSKKVEPGVYEVICNPEVAGLIAHEAFGHGVEMDMFVKNRAKATEYIGKPVASKLVTMHDGAAAAKSVSSYFFDDEGILGSDTVIIENGILKTGISDLLSSLKLKTKSTGNGKRQSFERKAYARMTNTFFAAGNDKLEDMIASIKDGYLLESFMSGMEDPKNWGIQCVIAQGKEIKDGKLTGKLVSPVIMTGYVPDLLRSISMVSDKVELSGVGMCGKGYKEYVKASDGGPYIKAKARLG